MSSTSPAEIRPAPRAVLGGRRLAFLASMMVIIGPLSLSLYTPAMPSLAAAFGTGPAAIKLSLTVYLLGFAFAQLICGPLSDRFGRRPVLISFCLVYLAGSALAGSAADIELLLVGRVVQGIGACAGVALSRAIVRDCHEGQAAARLFTTIAMFLSIAPAIAPMIGSLLLRLAGWPTIFLAMALYGLALLGVTVRLLPETNRRLDPHATEPRRMVLSYARLISDRRYVRMVSVMALSIGGIYTFHTITPFVYIGVLGLSPEAFALVTLTSAAAFFAGSRVTGALLRKVAADRLVVWGVAIVTAAAGLLLAALAVGPSVPVVALPVMVWAFGTAMLLPGTQIEALAPFPAMAGAAAAFMGFLQMGAGVLGSAAATRFPDSTQALTVVPATMAVIALAAYVGLGRGRKRAGPT